MTSQQQQTAILLCTYNGEKYILEQLNSFLQQTENNFSIWVSDDASTDSTVQKINDFFIDNFNLRGKIFSGPKKGVTSNFLSLICKQEIKSLFFALSDQDDVWEPEKLERAIHWLKTIPSNMPALYCARTRLVDENNIEIGFSPLFKKPPSFAHALVQNIASGNTMVFNHAARQLLIEAGSEIEVPIHDWWIYLVVTACGGKVFYDPIPTLRYRQHADNLIGINSGWKSRIKRLCWLFSGRFRKWSSANIDALNRLHYRITPENQDILKKFCRAREAPFPLRLILFLQSGVYRQKFVENLALFVAAVLKKI